MMQRRILFAAFVTAMLAAPGAFAQSETNDEKAADAQKVAQEAKKSAEAAEAEARAAERKAKVAQQQADGKSSARSGAQPEVEEEEENSDAPR